MSIEERVLALEGQVEVLDKRVSKMEGSLVLMTAQLDQFGNYRTRTHEELKLMNEQIGLMIDNCELLVQDAINKTDVIRAKAILRRLKNNKTRIWKALAA